LIGSGLRIPLDRPSANSAGESSPVPVTLLDARDLPQIGFSVIRSSQIGKNVLFAPVLASVDVVGTLRSVGVATHAPVTVEPKLAVFDTLVVFAGSFAQVVSQVVRVIVVKSSHATSL